MRKSFILLAATGLVAIAAPTLAQSSTATPTPAPNAAANTARPGPMAGRTMTRDGVQQMAAQMFARLDVNSDGELSEADRTAQEAARFDRIDTDGNGSISRAEFAAQREARGAGPGAEGGRMARAEGPGAGRAEGRHEGRREGRRGHERGMMGGGMMRGGREMLAQADANSDGKVSQAELTTAMLARFDAADADHDGTLSAEERRAMHPEGRGERRGARPSTNG